MIVHLFCTVFAASCCMLVTSRKHMSELWPTLERVAIILRGEIFRKSAHSRASCDETYEGEQFNATISLLDMIVKPLEQRGNQVDLFLGASARFERPPDPLCEKLFPRFVSWLGPQRVVATILIFAKSQPDAMRRVINFFKRTQRGAEDGGFPYKLIVVTRFDILWKVRLETWPTVDPTSFNFFSRCQPYLDIDNCVNDVFFMMPGLFFKMFDSILGQGRCFRIPQPKRTIDCSTGHCKHVLQATTPGHHCYPQIAKEIGRDNITFLTPWTPIYTVREDSDIACLHSCAKTGQSYKNMCVTNGTRPDRVPNLLKAAIASGGKDMFVPNTNCYEAVPLADAGRCCCTFWNAPAASLTRIEILMQSSMSTAAIANTCLSSFPEYSLQQDELEASSCGSIAIGVSGELRTNLTDTLKKVRGIVQPLQAVGETVDVFLHVTGEVPPVNLPLPNWVKGVVVEKNESAQALDAANSCTGGMVDELFTALTKQHGPFWFIDARRSLLWMHRHIFLAYFMAGRYAARASCKYDHYIRTRPDIEYNEDFGIVFKKLKKILQKVPVLTAASTPWLYNNRMEGVPPMDRCVVDDEFAVGEFRAMNAYASLFPDFTDFARYVPFYREDLYGQTNERLLTAHLHYRSAKFGDFSFNYSIHH